MDANNARKEWEFEGSACGRNQARENIYCSFFYSTLSQQIRYITKCKKRERVEKGMIQCRKILASKSWLWFCCWFRKWRKFCQAVTEWSNTNQRKREFVPSLTWNENTLFKWLGFQISRDGGFGSSFVIILSNLYCLTTLSDGTSSVQNYAKVYRISRSIEKAYQNSFVCTLKICEGMMDVHLGLV